MRVPRWDWFDGRVRDHSSGKLRLHPVFPPHNKDTFSYYFPPFSWHKWNREVPGFLFFQTYGVPVLWYFSLFTLYHSLIKTVTYSYSSNRLPSFRNEPINIFSQDIYIVGFYYYVLHGSSFILFLNYPSLLTSCA